MKQNETKQLFSVGHSRIVTLTLSVLFPFSDPIIFALNLNYQVERRKNMSPMSVYVFASVPTKCFCVCFYNLSKTSFILAQVTNVCWYREISSVEYFLKFNLRLSNSYGYTYFFTWMSEPAKFWSFFSFEKNCRGGPNPLSDNSVKGNELLQCVWPFCWIGT